MKLSVRYWYYNFFGFRTRKRTEKVQKEKTLSVLAPHNQLSEGDTGFNQLSEGDTRFVDVEKELSFLLSYVHLQRERLDDNYTITCWGLADVKGFAISPFLLLPLVENCFKHVSSDPGRGNYICIECRAKGHSFFFRTGNTCIATAAERPDKKAGIGLENVKKRLDLLYPDRHELFMKQRPGYYQTTLTLEC